MASKSNRVWLTLGLAESSHYSYVTAKRQHRLPLALYQGKSDARAENSDEFIMNQLSVMEVCIGVGSLDSSSSLSQSTSILGPHSTANPAITLHSITINTSPSPCNHSHFCSDFGT